jgi:hypothetical protein
MVRSKLLNPLILGLASAIILIVIGATIVQSHSAQHPSGNTNRLLAQFATSTVQRFTWRSLTQLHDVGTGNYVYDTQVYVGGHLLQGADPRTTKVALFQDPRLGNSLSLSSYVKDAHHVFYWDAMSTSFALMREADPATFTPIYDWGEGYAEDKRAVFYRDVRTNLDPASFGILLDPSGYPLGYVEDKTGIYYLDPFDFVRLDGVEVSTFQIERTPDGTWTGCVRDKSYRWCNGHIQRVTGG